MIDAYTHLDTSAPDPIADFQSRMASAGVAGALAVETWSGDNFPFLEQIVNSALPEFRVAPCFRPGSGLPSTGFLSRDAVVALRVKTADLSRIGEVGNSLATSQKWLLVHAEKGIAPLVNELITVRKRHPRLRVYVPHLGWPRREGLDDKDWADSIIALSRIRGVVVGISAIAHFSREPYPHNDVAAFASRLLRLFSSENVTVGSDFPMFDKDRYAEYIKLAIEWVYREVENWSPIFESACYSNSEESG
jgi:amidohydrolase family protein